MRTSPEMSDDFYQLLGVSAASTLEQVRIGYKEKALLHHPDRGGDPFQWAQIQKAYDTLSDQTRRATYDRARRAAASGAEMGFAKTFSDGAFDLARDDKAAPERKDAAAMNIVEKMAQVKADEARAKDAQRGSIATSASKMTHSAGFDAWLRNQKGLGKHGFYNAEDLLRKSKALGGGIEATDASSVPLPPLSTVAVSFAEHGPPEDVLSIERESALPRELQHGEVFANRPLTTLPPPPPVPATPRHRSSPIPGARARARGVRQRRRPGPRAELAQRAQRLPSVQPHGQQVGEPESPCCRGR